MKCGRIYKNFLPYPGTVQNGHTRAGPGSGTRYLVLYRVQHTVPGTAYCTATYYLLAYIFFILYYYYYSILFY